MRGVRVYPDPTEQKIREAKDEATAAMNKVAADKAELDNKVQALQAQLNALEQRLLILEGR